MYKIKTVICAVGYLNNLQPSLLWSDVLRILYIADLQGIASTAHPFTQHTYLLLNVGIVPYETYRLVYGIDTHPLWSRFIADNTASVTMLEDPGDGYLCEMYKEILTKAYKMFYSNEHRLGTEISYHDLLLDSGLSEAEADFYVDERASYDYLDKMIDRDDTVW
jgi:hypothetical protein